MPNLRLHVLSLRYSSWSMRPWLALTHAGARFETRTADVKLERQVLAGDEAASGHLGRDDLAERRKQGSITGLFPVLEVDGVKIHESLAICEWVNEAYPQGKLWPEDSMKRAQARALSCEMVSGFTNLRTHMSCQLFGRLPGFTPDAATQAEIDRIFEMWRGALEASGGPFLFGPFTIADAMYYPVRTRFRTYGIDIPADLVAYVEALDGLPAVRALVEAARLAPSLPAYDAHMRERGGDPVAALSLG